MHLSLPGRQAARMAMAALLACLAGGALPACAQPQPTTVRLRRQPALAGELLYWYVTPAQSATEPRPLPPEQADGLTTLEVPAAYNQPGTHIKILDVRRSRVARLPLPSPENPARQTLGVNLLKNGDFSGGEANWTLERGSPQAAAALTFPGDATTPPGVRGKVARCAVTALGAENWHVQLYQNGLDIRDGQPYTLTFWARAAQERPISLNLNVNTGDGHGLGLTVNQLPLTPAWKRFSFVFTPYRSVPGHNRLVFLLGDATGTVDLAGVALQPGKAVQPTGPNLLRNPDFVRQAEEWNVQSGPPPARMEAQFPAGVTGPPGAVGTVARFRVLARGAENWHTQIFQDGLNLEEGQPYTLTFWAKTEQARPLTLDATRDQPDWTHIGLNTRLELTPLWRRYTVTFTPTQTVPDHSRLVFILGDALGTVDLANLSLRREAPVPAEEVVLALGPEDFRYAQAVLVPVRYQGRGVYGVEVALQSGGQTIGARQLRAEDRGIVRFTDVPLAGKLTVVVHHGDRTATFERAASSDAPGTLAEVVLPDGWTDVHALAEAPAVPVHPLVGVWESRGSAPSTLYRFTFNADGTGSIRTGVAETRPGNAPRAPVTNPFRWYLRNNGREIVISSRIYTWSLTRTGGSEKLVLTERNGKTHVLYRR